jgi:hypothetical protein
MLIAEPTATGGLDIRVGLASDHQNSWYYAYGIDLLFEARVDSNLRALVARKELNDGNDSPMQMELRPKADGIIDFNLRNRSDWEVLRVDLCRTLVAAGSESIRCPAWAW